MVMLRYDERKYGQKKIQVLKKNAGEGSEWKRAVIS